MRTPVRRLGIPVGAIALVLAACGGDEQGSSTSAEVGAPASIAADAGSTTVISADVAVPPAASADMPAPLDPTGTADIPLAPVVSADLPYLIDVTVGVDSGPDRIDLVPLGATVSLSITNPDADDEFHLHGYDIGDGGEVPAGQTATFTFTASQAGDFELESHESHGVLLVLRVG